MSQGEHIHGNRLAQNDVHPPEPINLLLKCVWSGFPSHGRSCGSYIPASVVVRAWQREMEMQLGGSNEGFFCFSWRSGVWLGYGLGDGQVRGVYCPTHCAERESRGSRRHLVRAY